MMLANLGWGRADAIQSIDRRAFITLHGGAAACPLAARIIFVARTSRCWLCNGCD
jgi:hypothetical protein